MMYINEKIRLQRKRLGLTKNKLAQMAGISPFYVDKIEDGISKPSFDVVCKLAKALNINVDFFARNILIDTDMIEFIESSKNITSTTKRYTNLNDAISNYSSKPLPIQASISLSATKNLLKETTLKKSRTSSKNQSITSSCKEYSKMKVSGIKLNGENMVFFSRIISNFIKEKEFKVIVGLTENTKIVAGALSAMLFEKRGSQNIKVIRKTAYNEKSNFLKGKIKSGDKVVIFDEVVRNGNTLSEVAKKVKNIGAEVVIGIAIIDLLDKEKRKQLLDILPEYKFIFSENDVASVWKKNFKQGFP